MRLLLLLLASVAAPIAFGQVAAPIDASASSQNAVLASDSFDAVKGADLASRSGWSKAGAPARS